MSGLPFPICYALEQHTVIILRVTFWRGKDSLGPSPSGCDRKGLVRFCAACASMSCDTTTSLQNHWPGKCRNILVTWVLNNWPRKENSEFQVLVIGFFCFLFACFLCSSGRNNFLVALEENNLMVCLVTMRGKGEMLDTREGLFLPLGTPRRSLAMSFETLIPGWSLGKDAQQLIKKPGNVGERKF